MSRCARGGGGRVGRQSMRWVCQSDMTAPPAAPRTCLAAHSARAAFQAAAAGGEQRDTSHRSLWRSMRPVSRFMPISVVPAAGGVGRYFGKILRSMAAPAWRPCGDIVPSCVLQTLPADRRRTLRKRCHPGGRHGSLQCLTCDVDGQGAQPPGQPPRHLCRRVVQHAHARDAHRRALQAQTAAHCVRHGFFPAPQGSHTASERPCAACRRCACVLHLHIGWHKVQPLVALGTLEAPVCVLRAKQAAEPGCVRTLGMRHAWGSTSARPRHTAPCSPAAAQLRHTATA